MTNLEEAYQVAAIAFVKKVLQGEPAHIMPKLEKCPIIKNINLNPIGDAIFFQTIGRNDETHRFQLPENVRIKKKIKYEATKLFP